MTLEEYQHNASGELLRETVTYPSDVNASVNLPDHSRVGIKYSDYELTEPAPPVNNFAPVKREPAMARPNNYSTTIHCRHCACPSINHTSFPTVSMIQTATGTSVMFCPIHGRISAASKVSAYDSYACSLGLPYKQVVELVTQSKAILHTTTVKYTTHRDKSVSIKSNPIDEMDNIDWMEKMFKNAKSYGTTTVHIACNDCASLSTLTISNKVNNLGVHYCPHCASKSIVITQSAPTHTESFNALAEKYNIHPWYAESLYTMWATSYQNYPTFDAFMQTLPERFMREGKSQGILETPVMPTE